MSCLSNQSGNLHEQRIKLATSIAIGMGLILAPVSAIIISHLLLFDYLSRTGDFVIWLCCVVGAFVVNLVIVPLVAPKYLMRWQNAQMSIVSNSIIVGGIVSLIFGLPGLLTSSWVWFVSCLFIGVWYGFCIGVIYQISFKLLKRAP